MGATQQLMGTDVRSVGQAQQGAKEDFGRILAISQGVRQPGGSELPLPRAGMPMPGTSSGGTSEEKANQPE